MDIKQEALKKHYEWKGKLEIAIPQAGKAPLGAEHRHSIGSACAFLLAAAQEVLIMFISRQRVLACLLYTS